MTQQFKLRVVIVPTNELNHRDSSTDFPGYKRFIHLTDPSLSLRSVVKPAQERYLKLYRQEEPFNVVRFQDINYCDLDPDYCLEDVFGSGDILRIIVEKIPQTSRAVNPENTKNLQMDAISEDSTRVYQESTSTLKNINTEGSHIPLETVDDEEPEVEIIPNPGFPKRSTRSRKVTLLSSKTINQQSQALAFEKAERMWKKLQTSLVGAQADFSLGKGKRRAASPLSFREVDSRRNKSQKPTTKTNQVKSRGRVKVMRNQKPGRKSQRIS